MKINPTKNSIPRNLDDTPGQSSSMASNEIFPIFNEHSSGKRVRTTVLLSQALRERHSDYHLTVNAAALCPLISFANAGFASYTQRGNEDQSLLTRQFQPPARRYGDDSGSFASKIIFAAFDYEFQGNQFLVYIVDGRDGTGPYPQELNNYILKKRTGDVSGVVARTDELIESATKWALELHNQVLVFDQGYWQKNSELWKSIQKSLWKDVILDEEKKQMVISDIEGFFDSEQDYESFGVPWKVRYTHSESHRYDGLTKLERNHILWSSRKWQDYLDQSTHAFSGKQEEPLG